MRKGRSHMIDVLFVMALFCVFAVTSLLVVLFGADVYRDIAEDMATNNGIRTSLNYVTEKVRQSDGLGNIHIGMRDGEGALVLERTNGEDTLQTHIYLEDGILHEITVIKGLDIGEWLGQPVMELKGFSLQKLGEHVLEIRVKDQEGVEYKTIVTLRSATVLEGGYE